MCLALLVHEHYFPLIANIYVSMLTLMDLPIQSSQQLQISKYPKFKRHKPVAGSHHNQIVALNWTGYFSSSVKLKNSLTDRSLHIYLSVTWMMQSLSSSLKRAMSRVTIQREQSLFICVPGIQEKQQNWPSQRRAPKLTSSNNHHPTIPPFIPSVFAPDQPCRWNNVS